MPDVVPGAPQNESQPNVSHKHSIFPIEYDSFDTPQFGYVRPNFCVKGIPGDSLKYRPAINSRSYTLKAPLMQDVFRRLSYVKVNLDAVLPMNAEKVYTNPVKGDDVLPVVNTCVLGGFKKISLAVESVLSRAISDYNAGLDNPSLDVLLKALVFSELFYSRGSLLSSLGCHLYSQLYFQDTGSLVRYDFDDFFDKVIQHLIADITAGGIDGFNVTIDGKAYFVSISPHEDGSVDNRSISFHEFLCRIRETSDWNSYAGELDLYLTALPSTLGNRTWLVSDDVPFNFLRCCAYQLAVAEFMTNDHIDYIYSAELYRQNIGDLLRKFIDNILGSSAWPQNFTYNGVSYQYDYLSGMYLDICLINLASNATIFTDDDPIYSHAIFQYFINIFGIQRSLRFKDYFVGSRSNPLAVGDVNVNVNANLVNVVDITRKIQLQRFLNVVNHTGRRLGNYVKTLFGIDVSPDRHVPQFLAELTEKVYTAEVENTGSAQLTDNQSVTAIFTSNSSNKELEFGVDLECVIIGLISYDIARAYATSIDRDFFIKDRFDMFLPELQFVGDQPVYIHEINSASLEPFGKPFSYQYRDMQWKQIFSRASGGFVGKLPGYAFIFKKLLASTGEAIDGDFIRSYPAELDNFYISLTGYSLGNYWHFIEVTKHYLYANRQMIANPTILE